MSGNIKPDPYVPNLYNLNDYYHSIAPLTLAQGDDRYLQLSGGTLTGLLFCSNNLSVKGSITLNGTAITATASEINYLSGVVPGLGSASNAIVLDSSRNITNINSITTSTIDCTSSSTAINISGVSGDILLSGTASSIQCTGAASGIVITGTSSFLTLGASASLILNSITLTSTGTELNYLHGSTPGTATASNALVLDSSRNITNINSLTTAIISVSSAFNVTSTTDSTSTSTGSFTTLGGVGIAKKIYIGSNAEIASTTRITGVSSPATGSGLELAFGSSVSNIYSYNRGTSTYLDLNLNDKVLIVGATGNTSISSTTTTTSKTTGALVVSGGIGCSDRVYASRFTSNNNGSNYELINGSNTGLLELALSPNILRLVNGYAINVGTVGVTIGNGSTLVPRFPLDFQATAGDVQICLFAGTSTATSVYGIGANNSAVEYHSAVDHKFYNATKITGSTVTLGTNILNVNSVGNVIAAAGVHATGFSTTGLSSYGPAVHMHYGGSTGSVFTYDYSVGSYGNLALNNNCVQCLSNGYVNVNTSSTTVAAPLSVYGNAAFTRLSGTYGYLASSGSGTASGFSGRAFGIYSQYGILVDNGEIDCFSDLRMKQDVIGLDDELCARFIKNIDPIQFKYIHNNTKNHYGYGAQDLIAFGFNTLVGIVDADESLLDEKIITYKTDPDGDIGDMIASSETINLPSNVRCTVSMIAMIPILHKCIQMQMKRIDIQQESIDQLKQQINILREQCDLNIKDMPTPLRRTRMIIKKKIRII